MGALIREAEFFSGLDAEGLRALAACAREAVFEGGAYLFREGDPADRFFLLRHGRVALELHAADRGTLAVDTVGEGDVVGVSWLSPPFRWTFDGRAAGLVRAVEVEADCLRERLEADPRLGYELMKRFALVMQRRMQSARIRLLDLYGRAHQG